jgi:hypothetical protein
MDGVVLEECFDGGLAHEIVESSTEVDREGWPWKFSGDPDQAVQERLKDLGYI